MDVQTALGMIAARFQSTLDVEADPLDVRPLRHDLERTTNENGITPQTYSSLTPDMRAAAEGWFGLRSVDDID